MKSTHNPQIGKYKYNDLAGNITTYDLRDTRFEDYAPRITDLNGSTFSVDTDTILGRKIIINAHSIEFRAGEFELKVTDDRLMQELKHTDKIIINGISYIKEE